MKIRENCSHTIILCSYFANALGFDTLLIGLNDPLLFSPVVYDFLLRDTTNRQFIFFPKIYSFFYNYTIYSLPCFPIKWRVNEFFPGGHPRRSRVTLMMSADGDACIMTVSLRTGSLSVLFARVIFHSSRRLASLADFRRQDTRANNTLSEPARRLQDGKCPTLDYFRGVFMHCGIKVFRLFAKIT